MPELYGYTEPMQSGSAVGNHAVCEGAAVQRPGGRVFYGNGVCGSDVLPSCGVGGRAAVDWFGEHRAPEGRATILISSALILFISSIWIRAFAHEKVEHLGHHLCFDVLRRCIFYNFE